MMHIRRWILLLLAITLLSAVACRGGGGGPENVFIADEADSGETVSMGVGDVLQISLEENPTTGYMWSIVTNDEAVLRLSDEPAYEVASEAIGSGGTKTYLFEAAAPGTSNLLLVNAREQTTAVEPDRTFELTVQVSN